MYFKQDWNSHNLYDNCTLGVLPPYTSDPSIVPRLPPVKYPVNPSDIIEASEINENIVLGRVEMSRDRERGDLFGSVVQGYMQSSWNPCSHILEKHKSGHTCMAAFTVS